MRTFGEIQERIKSTKNLLMQKTMKSLQNGGLKDWEELADNMIIQECQNSIENIDEVTAMEIGAQTNSLIKSIQLAYQYYLSDYWGNFEKFINDYVLGLTPDGHLRNGAFFGRSQCNYLGIGINDLLCFKGRYPMSNETCDLFRQVINANYGTNIPMSGVLEQALEDLEAAWQRNDEIEEAQALVHLRELQRDAGILKNGATYSTLANDQRYQDAKAICEGRSL